MGKVSLPREPATVSVRKKRKKKSFLKKTIRVVFHALSFLMSDAWIFAVRHKIKIVIIFITFTVLVALGAGYTYVRSTILETSSFSDEYILKRISKHITLPAEYPESLVRVEDSETLKKELPLETRVKNGDYIIVYPRLYIIYDAQHDSIVFTKESQRE